jgi:hypothetical protein
MIRPVMVGLHAMLPGIASALFGLVASSVTIPSAHAQATAVDLELILAVDVSGSIDPVEAQLQREGYMAALSSDAVIEAIRSGVLGRIALTYVEWAGIEHQQTLVEWRIIESRADAEVFVAALAEVPLRRARRTSISGAIRYAATLLANDIESTRQVIDISGDGPNNSGPLVSDARDAAMAEGIVINGLPIINDRPNPFGLHTMKELDLYFENCVIGGRGAFIVVAESFDDFATAVLSKLILEISDIRPGPNPLHRHASLMPAGMPPLRWLAPSPLQHVQVSPGSGLPATTLPLPGSPATGLPGAPKRDLPPGVADCTIGERQWQRFRQGYDDWP